MRFNKRGLNGRRGLSDVVTTGLIILLAIAAVVIVWSFVKPAIIDVGGKISAKCITIDAVPVSCIAATGMVVAKNGPGEISLDSVRLVYGNANNANTEVITSTCSPTPIQPLATSTCTPANPPTTTPNSVAVAGVIGTGSDIEVCGVSSVVVACT